MNVETSATSSRQLSRPATTWPTLRTHARERPVVLYFVLAYLASWMCWLPAVVADGPVTEALIFVGVWGPAAAAATVTALRGDSVREWLRRLFRWRVAARWYVFALALPVAMIAAVSLPFVALGHDLDGSLLGARAAAYLPMLVFLSIAGAATKNSGGVASRSRSCWSVARHFGPP